MPKNDSTAVLVKNAEQIDDVIYVGVDDGHAEIKIVTSNGLKFKMPSKAVDGRQIVLMNDGNLGFDLISIMVDGQRRDFTVSNDLQESVDTRTKTYPFSDLNLALIHAALGKAGLGKLAGEGSQKVKICTGLPIGTAYLPTGLLNAEIIEAKKQNLTRKVEVEGFEACEIVSNHVLSEGIAALIDLIVDDEGKATKFGNACASTWNLVIDIGGRTTDFGVLLPGGTRIDFNRFGSIETGMMELSDRVANRVRAELKLDSAFNGSHPFLSTILQTGQIKWAGKTYDFSEVVKDEIK